MSKHKTRRRCDQRFEDSLQKSFPALSKMMTESSGQELLPLEWVVRVLLKPLQEALDAIDRIPFRTDIHAQWLEARKGVYEAQTAVVEITRLAYVVSKAKI